MAFDWFKKNKTVEDTEKTRQRRTTNPATDFTNSLSVNSALTRGIYRNTYPGMKLAGFGFNIINVPVSFMGLPVVELEDDEENQEYLQSVTIDMAKQIRSIHTQSHRDGTVWVYPKYDRDNGLVWEMIPDQAISKILIDIETNKTNRIIRTEELTLNSPVDDTEVIVTRKIVYTTERVITTYEGDTVTAGLSNSEVVNVSGVLPIPFANNADVNEIRGNSDYERILSDLKAYHDVDLAELTILSKFTTKMIQVVKDHKTWLANNGYSPDGSTINDLNIYDVDLIFNQEGEETDFIHPTDSVNGYETKLKTIFHKLVELSGIPEIAWGLKTEGNLASVEENMAILMQYCRDKQEQKKNPYKELYLATARLLSMAGLISDVSDLTITWNVLDSTSEKTKSEIMKNFSDALSKIINVAGMTKDQLFRFWKTSFPSLTEEDFEAWKVGIDQMTAHVVKTKASPSDLLDLQGADLKSFPTLQDNTNTA